MPYSTAYDVVYGTDARRLRTWARRVLLDFIDDKMNDESGPYYTPLELDSELVEGEWTRKVLVTGSAKLAAQRYPKAAVDPVVFIERGPVPDWQPSGKTIGGTFYEGKRTELSFPLDSAYDRDDGTLESQEDFDAMPSDFVIDILTRGCAELAALGLHNVVVVADEQAQLAGDARNPLLVTCFVKSLDTWTP